MHKYRLWKLFLLLVTSLPLACAGKKAPPEAVQEGSLEARNETPQGETLPPPDPELLVLLSELRGEYRTRTEAREALVARGREVTPYLIPLLEDDDYLYRWRVVNVLGYLEDPAATLPIVELVLREGNPHPRYRAHWALRRIERDGHTARKVFAEVMVGPDTVRAWRAAVAMAYFYDERALPLVHEKLTSMDQRERWEAVSSLGNIHDEQSSALMEPLLLTDSWKKVRHEAALTLGQICDEKALELLATALEQRDPQLRWRAAKSLGDCGKPQSIPGLEARLETERHDTVRKHIEKSLEALGTSN